MATTIKLSAIELAEKAQAAASEQCERLNKEALTAAGEMRQIIGFSAIQKELERMTDGTDSLTKQLHEQTFTLQDSIAKRLQDITSLNVRFPTSLSSQLESMYERSLKAQLDKIPCVQLESLIRQAAEPHHVALIPREEFFQHQLEHLVPASEHIRTVADVVSESVSELAEKIEHTLREDASASQNQLMKVAKMMDTLVKVTLKSSEENSTLSRRNTWLAIVMVLAAIAQCIIMLWPSIKPWLLHYLF